ncbi:PREDICTED: uncharacterized protein LOC105366554 [Ceratosolen solmsi marchali]|uniref:Uncharacterized protein LOC105366554 n=1 Tax=Ceratosolen solmsi marchali TaxID=326594 RepID=A0AAJ6YSF5_9HYME|nr:PREDICTED: uncharacterized protein LOC105366554 [Ceratosolen solmsi marchali]
MYRQIKIHKDDWDLQRILWIDENGAIVPYHLTTVTYGTKAAPYLAVRTLLQLVKDEGSKYPLAVPPITHGRYFDDIFGSADTPEQLVEVALQLRDLCKAGGFPLAKWHATHQDGISAINVDQNDNNIQSDDYYTKILGLTWSPQEDKFTFTTGKALTPVDKLTKRLVLSKVARIFDPLGFATPVWDEKLPPQLLLKWSTIRKDLSDLTEISIPRWLNMKTTSTIELHGFSDASQLAMSAVIYVSAHESDDVKTTLVCSKTKVAPLKPMTIPRLELTAVLLLSKLMRYVQAKLKMDLKATYMWTDSRVTLAWIKTHPARWKEFIRNRVSNIQNLTSGTHWRYVPALTSHSFPSVC